MAAGTDLRGCDGSTYFPTCVFQTPLPRAPVALAGPLTFGEARVCGEQAAWPGLAPCQHFGGVSGTLVAGSLGLGLRSLIGGPAAQGERDIAPGSSRPPPRPTAVGVRCGAAAGQPLSVSGPFPCLLDGAVPAGQASGAIPEGVPVSTQRPVTQCGEPRLVTQGTLPCLSPRPCPPQSLEAAQPVLSRK